MEEKKITGIPNTNEIKLDSGIDQWRLFIKGLITKFSTKGIIVVDKDTNRKVSITIVLQLIVSPQQYIATTHTKLKSSEGIDVIKSAGIVRVDQFFMNELDKSTWLLVGYIIGRINTPILIHYYEKFNYSVYSLLKEDSEIMKYFPKGLPTVNPQSN